jgi:RNA polymerase sigma factor for flagellar operon FliA
MSVEATPQAAQDDEAALWQRWRADGDAQARAGLIERHLPYARTVAATYYARRTHDEIEFVEYLQFASVALVESVDRYLPDRGAQFRTFAARRMHGAILDGIDRLTEKQQQIAAQRRLRQERLRTAMDDAERTSGVTAKPLPEGDGLFAYLAEVGIGLALGILLEGTGMVDQDAIGVASEPELHYRQVEMAQLKRRLAQLVGRLPTQQRRVLQLHYLHDHSFADVAVQLEVSRGRVSQIHRQALDALRRALTDGAACDLAC